MDRELKALLGRREEHMIVRKLKRTDGDGHSPSLLPSPRRHRQCRELFIKQVSFNVRYSLATLPPSDLYLA